MKKHSDKQPWHFFTGKGGYRYENPENARFCEACGSETYFYSMGFLKGWEEVKTTRP